METKNCSLSITVCTPTFNRGSYLDRVFDSLCIQDFCSFEWIIVDDGSTDQTDFVVNGIASIAKFPVIYIKQPNSGKHVAVNKALDLARGELFLVLDSDDRCTADALSFFYTEWQGICDRKTEVAGITVLTMDRNGEVVGSPFPYERCIDFLPQFYERFRVMGDKWNIHQTAILKEYRFPETPNENFCPEGLVWNRIATRYKMLFVNKPLGIKEYLPDGLSANITKRRIHSPINTMMYYHELIESNLSLISRLRGAVNYFRFALHSRKYRLAFRTHPFCGFLVLVISAVFLIVDTKRIRRYR